MRKKAPREAPSAAYLTCYASDSSKDRPFDYPGLVSVNSSQMRFLDNMTQNGQVALSDNKQQIQILLDQYKLLKDEANQNSLRNNKQSSYIQIYGIFIFTTIGALFGYADKFDPQKLPIAFRIPLLMVSAALLFYYYAQIYLCSFSFRVLRHRMGHIELEINKKIGNSLLIYESHVAPKFFGSASLEGRALTPHTWLQFFSLVLFLSAIYLLGLLSVALLPQNPGFSLFYIANLLFFAVTLIWENFRLTLPESLKFPVLGIEKTPHDNTIIFLRLSRYFWNYSIVVVLVFIFFFGQFEDPVSTPTIEFLRNTLNTASNYEKSYILWGVLIYSALCAIALPTPSELPLVLVGVLGVGEIFLACVVGKALGSLSLSLLTHLLFRTNNLKPEKLSGAIENSFARMLIGGKKGHLAYFICQAIPFLPMRSSTIGYTAITPLSMHGVFVLATASGLGTLVRMTIFGALVSFGIWSFPSLGVAP